MYRNIAEMNTCYPPNYGFIPDITSVKDIIDKRLQYYESKDIGSFADLNSSKVIDVTAFVRDSLNMGTDKLTAEIQRQLNDWKGHKF